MVRARVVLLALALATMVSPVSVSGQGLLDISPNHPGVWTVDRGVIQFNVMHRLRVFDPLPAEDGVAEGRTEGRVADDRVARPVGDTVVVSMDNRLRFLPDTVRIRVGQAVRWENPSAVVHTVTADPSSAADPDNVAMPEGAAPFDSGDMVPGDSYVHVFRVAGEYRYVCLPHELAGMVGTVLVEDEAS